MRPLFSRPSPRARSRWAATYVGALAFCAAATLGAPGAASASASPMLAAPLPLPGVVVTGAAVADGAAITVRCVGTDPTNDSSACSVEASFGVRALEPGVEVALPSGVARTWVDGAPAAGTRSLGEGERIEVSLRFERALSVRVSDPDSPWILSPVRVRHPLLGESPSLLRAGDGADGVLLDGVQLTLVGAIHVDASARGAVLVHVGAEPVDGVADVAAPRPSLSLSLLAGAGDDPVVQAGGPVLAVGLRGTSAPGDEGRFAMALAYEIAFVEHVVGSIALETDFDSLAESLVLELASPELAILVPSFAAGLGVVLRQGPNREEAAALRVRLGAGIFAVGVVMDFDYWPAIGDWTLTAAVRISI